MRWLQNNLSSVNATHYTYCAVSGNYKYIKYYYVLLFCISECILVRLLCSWASFEHSIKWFSNFYFKCKTMLDSIFSCHWIKNKWTDKLFKTFTPGSWIVLHTVYSFSEKKKIFDKKISDKLIELKKVSPRPLTNINTFWEIIFVDLAAVSL